MDSFGIGSALRGVTSAYFQGARQTGRTTRLLDSLKNGDRVACLDQREATRLKQECRLRHLEVEIIVVNPKNPHALLDKERPKGRTMFEHTWVEQFYESALMSAQADIRTLQDRSSTTAHDSDFKSPEWKPKRPFEGLPYL